MAGYAAARSWRSHSVALTKHCRRTQPTFETAALPCPVLRAHAPERPRRCRRASAAAELAAARKAELHWAARTAQIAGSECRSQTPPRHPDSRKSRREEAPRRAALGARGAQYPDPRRRLTSWPEPAESPKQSDAGKFRAKIPVRGDD